MKKWWGDPLRLKLICKKKSQEMEERHYPECNDSSAPLVPDADRFLDVLITSDNKFLFWLILMSVAFLLHAWKSSSEQISKMLSFYYNAAVS